MDHNIVSLVQTIMNAVLGGSLVAVWLRYRIQTRQLTLEESEEIAERKRSDFDRALEVVTHQRDDALGLVAECRDRLEKMEMEVQGLRLARDLDPFPSWVVGLDGRYLFANREFEKIFLEPIGRDYRSIIGETHDDLWPEGFAKTLRNLDSVASRVPDGHARAVTSVQINGNVWQVTIHKFPIRVRGSIVAFAGYVTDIQSQEEKLM